MISLHFRILNALYLSVFYRLINTSPNDLETQNGLETPKGLKNSAEIKSLVVGHPAL